MGLITPERLGRLLGGEGFKNGNPADVLQGAIAVMMKLKACPP